MDVSSLIRISANATLAAVIPTVAPAVIPAFGPPAIELFGITIPIVSMACSMFGLAMARGISAAREGPQPGGWYLNGTLAIILFGIVIERQPGVGTAVAWGVGVGASGILAIDLLKDRFLAMFGKTKP